MTNVEGFLVSLNDFLSHWMPQLIIY